MNSPDYIQPEQLLSILFKSPNATAVYSGDEITIISANEAMLTMWGKDRKVVGRKFAEALPELSGQPFLEILKDVWHSGNIYLAKDYPAILEVNGELQHFYFDFEYKPILDENGKTTYILHTAFEVSDRMAARKVITEKSKAEERLTKDLGELNEEYQMTNEELLSINSKLENANKDLINSRETVNEINTRLQIALDASSLGSTEVNIETGIMQSTDQFKRNFGFKPEEDFKYSDLFEAMLPEHRERVKGLVQEAIRTNGIYKTEYPVKWRDGSIHWIQAHGRPRYDENGKADRMVGMTADITEKKLFEQRKDDFLSIASHELKTPLTILKASIQLLDRLKEKPFSETHSKLLDQSMKSVDTMVSLIDELLNMRRMNEDQLKLEKTEFNLFDMLSNSCNHIRMEGKYELVIQGDKNINLVADENRIEQVVINFVNNAVKYASNSNQIQINIETVNNEVKVSVKDFGEGIDAAILPNLFDRYYRADHSGKSYSGLGLGLYICAEIIKKHNGNIGADSKIGEGSTFWFTLPL